MVLSAPSKIPLYSAPPSPIANAAIKPENPILSSSPVSTSLNLSICDDLVDVTITVDALLGDKTCQWLAARKVYQEILCVESHLAYHICEETCGKCSDDCIDLSGTFPDHFKKGADRNCRWLADRGISERRVYCEVGEPAHDICLETCHICDGQD
jgi:hypothetical protein